MVNRKQKLHNNKPPSWSIAIFLSILMFLANAFPITAQSSECTLKIQEAEDFFNNGIFEIIPDLLNDCLESFSLEEKQKAYRLMILAQYMNDDVLAAENTMLQFLKEFPKYKPTEDELEDFLFVYNSFEAQKKLELGFFAGPVLAFGIMDEPWSSFDQQFNYSIDKPGMTAGGYINIIFSKLMSLNLQPAISSYRFKIDYDEPISGVLNLTQTEKHTLLEIPVYLQFTFLNKNVQPYVNVGLKGGYLIASETRGRMDRIQSESMAIMSNSVTYSRDNLEYRNRFCIYPGGSLGIKINFNNMYIFGQLDYHHSFTNVFKNGSKRFEQNNLWTEGWFDSDFRIVHTSFKFGVVLGIYQITKIR